MNPTANRTPPRLHLGVLCSYVELDAKQQPFSLVEPLFGIAIQPDVNGALPAPDIELYVQLEDEHAAGTYWFAVEVRNPRDDRVPGGCIISNGRTKPVEVTFAGNFDALAPFEHVFVLRGLVFPDAGWYHFHVMCNHFSMHEKERTQPPLQLLVVPAEAPTVN
jgi:hypothetical protein